jgi:hypothetical protein
MAIIDIIKIPYYGYNTLLLDIINSVCVYYCRTYDKAVCGGGGGQ